MSERTTQIYIVSMALVVALCLVMSHCTFNTAHAAEFDPRIALAELRADRDAMKAEAKHWRQRGKSKAAARELAGYPQEWQHGWWDAYNSLHVASAGDVITTCIASHNGARETNPLIGNGDDACLRSAVLSGLMGWLVHRSKRREQILIAIGEGSKRPKKRWWIATMFRSWFAVGNLKAIADERSKR